MPIESSRSTSVDEAALRGLLELVAGTDVEELEVRIGGARVLLRRDLSSPALSPVPTPPDGATPTAISESSATEHKLAVTSPLVGLFHPGVKEGDSIKQGQPLGTIEAMGMRTSVDAPRTGMVEALLSLEGSPVEFGQPLLVLRREDDLLDAPLP